MLAAIWQRIAGQVMNPEKLVQQAETYSNALVAFAVLQGIAYSYAFGTNEMFNCTVRVVPTLAAGLSLMFLVILVLMVVAVLGCRSILLRVVEEHRDIVARLYTGKLVAIVIFGLLPLLITWHYGVSSELAVIECNTLIRVGAGESGSLSGG